MTLKMDFHLFSNFFHVVCFFFIIIITVVQETKPENRGLLDINNVVPDSFLKKGLYLKSQRFGGSFSWKKYCFPIGFAKEFLIQKKSIPNS
jgi:hypothetical protein